MLQLGVATKQDFVNRSCLGGFIGGILNEIEPTVGHFVKQAFDAAACVE